MSAPAIETGWPRRGERSEWGDAARCGARERGDARGGGCQKRITASIMRGPRPAACSSFPNRFPPSVLHRERERAIAADRITFCVSVLRALTARGFVEGLLTVVLALVTGHCCVRGRHFFRTLSNQRFRFAFCSEG